MVNILEHSFDTYTRTHTHSLDFSADYGAHHWLFMFEFDSHQGFLCSLLCYELSLNKLFFFLFKF